MLLNPTEHLRDYRAVSSVGQSACLTSRRSQVRALHCPPSCDLRDLHYSCLLQSYFGQGQLTRIVDLLSGNRLRVGWCIQRNSIPTTNQD